MTATPENPPSQACSSGPEAAPSGLGAGLLPGGVTEEDLRVTPAQLAGYLRLSRQTVHGHKKAGTIRFDSDGRAPLARARRDYAANVDHAKAPGRAGPVPADVIQLKEENKQLKAERDRLLGALDVEPDDTGTGLVAQRAELLRLQAERQRLALAREQGESIDAGEARATLEAILAILHRSYQELPHHITYNLGLEYPNADAEVVHQVVDRLARAWQWEVARAMEALLGAPPALPSDPATAGGNRQ